MFMIYTRFVQFRAKQTST